MSIKIYNSLSRKKEIFEPLKKGKVSIYVCGPTVYGEPHIGHVRSAYIFEVIRRYLEFQKYKVKFVRNITDVDDKIINKAREEFKDEDISLAVKKVSKKYFDAYYQCMDELGIKKPDFEPKATEYIKKMVAFIEKLIKKSAAYESGGDVYFDVGKVKSYGKLSNQSLEMLESGSKKAKADNKRNRLDFALWKKVKTGEPSWPSPWGQGRPGWHVECSVMSSDILGSQFDIHGGGIDLIFPHHENEIAQSEAAGGKFARYWIHNGLLTINKEKMAKSLGNFITIKEIKDRGYSLDVLKLLFLQTHYSHPVDFSWEIMDGKKSALYVIITALDYIKREEEGRLPVKPKIIDIENKLTKFSCKEIDKIRDRFKVDMDNNFNMPMAMTVLFAIARFCEGILFYSDYSREKHLPVLKYARKTIEDLGEIFGLSFGRKPLLVSEEKINRLIAQREELRKQKKYKEADQVRMDLENDGIILKDAEEGTTWERKG